MPAKYEPRFTRQMIPKVKKGGLVIPGNAGIKKGLPKIVTHVVESMPPPTSPPTSFRFHYVDYPFQPGLFEDGRIIENGIYEFLVKDAVLSTYDLQTFSDDEFCWSFATTDQTVVLVALNIGETFDVRLKRPFKKILHISRSHFPPGVPNSGYGRFSIHVTNDEPRNDWFRITTSYEPGSPKSDSRLPFFFGFKLFGFRRQDKRPIWRRFLSDAVIFALSSDWGTGLMHVAFALESFIDMKLIQMYKRAKFPTIYEDHLLRVGGKKEELHALWYNRLNKGKINKMYENLNKRIFTLRNNIAHGRKNSEDITDEEYIISIKTAVEFMWDLDVSARPMLVPIMHLGDASSLIDQKLITSCGSTATLTRR